jgi:putative ABC transport system permease protein
LFANASIDVKARSNELRFSGTLQSEKATTPVSFRVVDPAFPLTGELLLKHLPRYQIPARDEILLDTTAAERLQIGRGDSVSFGNATYQVADIIEREPDALASGVRFYPRVILSFDGLERNELNSSLLRADYKVSILFATPPESAQLDALIQSSTDKGMRISIAGRTQTGAMRRLAIIERFLAVTALITVLLASVNIYVSMLSLLKRIQHTFAILRVLGAGQPLLLGILIITAGSMVGIAGGLGMLSGLALSHHLQTALVWLLISASTLAAGVPAWIKVMDQSPRALLSGSEEASVSRPWLSGSIIFATALPFWLFTSYMLRDLLQGSLVLAAVLIGYFVIALGYRMAIRFIYQHRHRFGFMLHSILAQKHDDGIFGTVSFASLFLGLTAFATLTLCHASLEQYLDIDLTDTLPPIYIVDIQPSQFDSLIQHYPDLNLFPNVQARIVQIDDRRIQEAIAQNSPDAERELGREFNITYRTYLMDTERILEGEWTPEQPGTFSVETEFAQRAGIQMGSRIRLAVQGFPVEGVVTSLREADRRSGLPFFFIVGTPQDFSHFPTTYFGYAWYTQAQQQDVMRFVAQHMPNISVIDTREARSLAQKVVSALLLLTVIIVLPSLILAALLIIALILLAYGNRRRDAARLLAIGASHRFVERLYLIETVSTTLLASTVAYLLSLAATWYILSVLLDITLYTFFTPNLLLLWLCLLAGVALTGTITWKLDKRPIQRTLANEENY